MYVYVCMYMVFISPNLVYFDVIKNKLFSLMARLQLFVFTVVATVNVGLKYTNFKD